MFYHILSSAEWNKASLCHTFEERTQLIVMASEFKQKSLNAFYQLEMWRDVYEHFDLNWYV